LTVKVVLRADASVSIGTGHVMRCLTLADALKRRGADCHFICAVEPGHLLDVIRFRGYSAFGLQRETGAAEQSGCMVDAAQTSAIATQLAADWVAVDHYGLGVQWEREVRSMVRKLLVIDDIGRLHHCDALLDQNFSNPTHARYKTFPTNQAELLLGSSFALVRSEFAAVRELARARRDGSLVRLLVTMGGSDPAGETNKVLAGLRLNWKSHWEVSVVIGAANPHAVAIEQVCRQLPNATLHIQTPKMAELMLAADCAIAAGGSTTWERCCLGLPTLVTVASQDQLKISEAVAGAGAQILMGWNDDLTPARYAKSIEALTPTGLSRMSAAAFEICDGLGADRVAERLG
jgi:UDP-2,4-diacetamido-2,4,6-trideoxy-beta-L-altropyranose hydrolase